MNDITKNRLELKAPAKVNLFLEILGRRDDGYHDIYSLFQAVSLYDRLHFVLRREPGTDIRFTRPANLPPGKDNLIDQAYRLMQREYKLDRGLSIDLDKCIPIAAGLAGGSADAAVTIAACNILFDLGLHPDQMASLGARIGSDLPFFFSSGQALVSGRGEQVASVTVATDYWLVLITPPIQIATARAYASLKSALTKQKAAVSFNSCQTVGALIAALRKSGNDFEPVQLASYPVLADITNGLLDAGASLVRMSGSGPTIYGMFCAEPDMKRVQAFCRDEWAVHVARPVGLKMHQ